MPLLSRLHGQHADRARWALVYIAEAHAVDEWPIRSARYEPSGQPVSIAQHRSDAERAAAARRFRETFAVPFPVLADPIDGRFEASFCTWPFRFYVIRHGRVLFRAQPEGCSYNPEALVRVLDGLAPVS